MIGTFLASEIRLLSRSLVKRGLGADDVLRSVGLNPSLIDQPRARYPFDRVAAAWARAVDVTGDPDLGFDTAETYRPTDFHGLAVVFLASSDLETALERLARYHRVLNTALKVRIEKSKDRIDVLCSSVKADPKAVRVLEDGRAAIVVDLCRIAVEGTLDPVEVAFTYPRPASESRHVEMFRASIVFGAPEWRVSFRRSDAERLLLASNRELARSNDQILDSMVKSLRQDDLVSRVKMAMVDELASGTPSEGSIAKVVSMSPRSLQRRLAALHTSFTELLSAVRRELAEQYVRDRSIPVTEISYMLGFSDLSSFSRAFKRWTGRSPAEWRGAHATA